METTATARESWDLQVQISTSTTTSPASSAGSPAHDYEGPPSGLAMVKHSLSDGWQLPTIEYDFMLSDFQFRDPFASTVQGLRDVVPCQSGTPPILIPSPKSQAVISPIIKEQTLVDSPVSGEVSPLAESFRSRRTSISFNPKVTLDCGCKAKLEEPIPKADRASGRGGDSSLGRSLLGQLKEASESHLSLHRAQTDSRRRCGGDDDDEATTGQPRNRKREIWKDALQNPCIKLGEPRHPLLQSTVEAMAKKPGLNSTDRMASLTSDSTASAVLEEASPPTDSQIDFSLSPVRRPSPLRHPTSLETSSAWPVPPRPHPSPYRAKSYSLEPRHRRRSQPTRSTIGSRRSSQASSFLSNFGTVATTVVEPDAEGQEVCDYVLGKQIDFGGFSVVKQAFTIHGTEQITRAVKIVRKRISGKTDMENEQVQADFEHEVSIWRILNHKHILPLIAVYDTPFATYCFMPRNVGGSLFDLVRTQRHGISGPLAKRYAYQLASALQYLHDDVRIAHRDVKLENCLLDMSRPCVDGGGHIWLCDFGMAQHLSRDKIATGQQPLSKVHGPSQTSTSIAGSLQYASPELILSQPGHCSTAVDLWAFGVVVYALLVGKLPFQHTFLPKLQTLILRGEWSEPDLREAPGLASGLHDALDLIKACLDMNPASRWSIQQVLECLWLRECHNLKVLESPIVEPGWRIDED